MRVHSIDLYSNDNLVVNFVVNGPDVRNPYILKAIAGLDAEEITPTFYGQGYTTKTKFYDMVLQPREIVMKIGLNPDYNLNVVPGDLRGTLLKAISSSRSGKMQLRLNDDEVAVGVISGFVTKFEAPVSTKEPEVQITLRCDDPLFKSSYLVNQVLTGLSVTAPVITDPVSTAPHGFNFKITITSDMTPPWGIQDNTTPDWKFQLNNVLLSGDQMFFSSETNNKYLYLIRSSVTYHLMDIVEQGSVWPLLFPGENHFDIIGGSSFVWNEIYWYDTHWGV